VTPPRLAHARPARLLNFPEGPHVQTAKAFFHWDDPLKLDAQLTVDERMVRESVRARACSQDRLASRGLQAFLNEQTDPAILREMGDSTWSAQPSPRPMAAQA